MSDLFLIEESIKVRIAEQLPEIRAIYSIRDIGKVSVASLQTPCVVVSFDGDTVNYDRFNGDQFILEQSWSVNLIFPSKYTIAEIGNAGVLMGDVLRVLSGWVPNGGSGKMKRRNASPVHIGEVYSEYNQVFTCDVLANQTDVN